MHYLDPTNKLLIVIVGEQVNHRNLEEKRRKKTLW